MRLMAIKVLLLIYASLGLAGCGAAFSPHYLDPSFYEANVDFISVLPAVDIRKDRSVDLDEGWELKTVKKGIGARGGTAYRFKWKGYNPVYDNDFGGVDNISEDDLIAANSDWINKLGPEDSRWIFLFVLEDLVTRKTFGHTYATECSAVLYDKESGKAVWKHKYVREAIQGGLGGLLTAGGTGQRLVRECFGWVLWDQFPKRK